MDKQVAIRRVRIAVSAFFGVLTVALAVLWVRSYWWRDNLLIEFSQTNYAQLSSEQGVGAFLVTHTDGHNENRLIWINPWKLWNTRIKFFPFNGDHPRWMGFDVNWFDRGEWEVFVPHWFLCLFTGAIAVIAADGLSNRFSLRTMLLATTLVAAVLGWGAWLTR